MAVDVLNLKKLKMVIVAKFNEQLLLLQLGHPYKENKLLTEAMDYIEYLETIECRDTRYETLVTYYYNKLFRQNGDNH